MKLRAQPAVLLLLLALIPCFALPADAALLSISSSGNGVFVLQGADLTGVGGIEATIKYDTATLANPRVDQGGLIAGASLMPNTNTPGVVRILVISPKDIAGSGVVAAISFDRPGGSAGRIISLDAVLLDAKGVSHRAQTQVVNPADIFTPESATTAKTPVADSQTSPADTAATASAQGYAAPGTLTMPGETGEPPKQPPVPEISPEQPVAPPKGEGTGETATGTAIEPRVTPQPPAAPAKGKDVVYPGVPEHFRSFKGEKSPQSLTALFAAATIPGVRQEPGIVLTDGATRVKISIQLQSGGKEAPNFALTGAKFISLKPEEDAWVIEALPDSNGYMATITVLHNGFRTEIPLVIAPPLAAGSAADEAGFILFLKERGTDKAPLHDLNGDGVRNYLDDYIFTANFIVKRAAGTKASPQMIW